MNDAVAKIIQFERRVRWRRRLISLQDTLVLAITIGGLIAAGLILFMSFRGIAGSSLLVISGAIALAVVPAVGVWLFDCARDRGSALMIDQRLGLEDRLPTADLIIARGGPNGGLEGALIEDAAYRITDNDAAFVAPFGVKRWHALLMVSLIALVAATMVPARVVPVTEELAQERRDIESAGEYLEQTGVAIATVPPETQSADLAREQAELGRGFKHSTVTRAEALRRLYALEERMSRRRTDLASTRADEIVSLAQRRLGGALTSPTTIRREKPASDKAETDSSPDGLLETTKKTADKERAMAQSNSAVTTTAPREGKAGEPNATQSKERARARNRIDSNASAGKGAEQAKTGDKPLEPVSGQSDSSKDATAEPRLPEKSAVDQRPTGSNAGNEKTDEQRAAEQKSGDQPPEAKVGGDLDALKAVPNSLAEQAVKALPKVSDELLKKAAELRARQLSPSDIEKLRQAAAALSGELTQISQSKELQQALQEMARQISPEQIEKVARELAGQEDLKQELEAATRLLMENQQAKEIVAGLAGQLARQKEQMRPQQLNPSRGQQGREPGPGDGASLNRRDGERRNVQSANAGGRLTGEGKEKGLQGKQKVSGGEYLYLQSKAGPGAARAPYSSGYPQYRREAERSVQRSRVPSGLRSVVRKYFDAINPDAKK
ncbi:MAG: hypothetical protein WAV20_25900 [Blastocatellia bacterium]